MAEIPTAGGSPSPIADLSYRGYDGVLEVRRARWWIIAQSSIRLTRLKKGFWVLVSLSAFPFVIMGAQMFFASRMPGSGSGNGGGLPSGPSAVMSMVFGATYGGQFYTAFTQQGFLLFVLAIMAGSGSIAADNQANALLVYLAKPITKVDYLVGKWMGVFLLIAGVAAAPAVLLYLYCLVSYSAEGFFSKDPGLLLRVIGAAAVSAAIHASLLVGFSAWSKTPRMAGAVYAGFYFVSAIVSSAVWGISTGGRDTEGILLRHLNVSGLIEGIAQNIYGVPQTIVSWRNEGLPEILTVDPPSLGIMLLLGGAVSLLGILFARAKIRAVEVVRG